MEFFVKYRNKRSEAKNLKTVCTFALILDIGKTRSRNVTVTVKKNTLFRELKHRRFWATDVNRKSKLLPFDAFYSLLVENFKL